MSVKERREQEKKHRREQIINAAEKVVFEKGIEHVRMDEVAEIAQVSKGTLYLYFKSKMELALAIHLRGLKILLKQIASELSKPGKGIELIQRMSRCFFEFAEEYPHYFKLFVYYETIGIDIMQDVMDTSTMAECNKIGDEVFYYIVRAVQVGIQDGTIENSLNPHNVALQIMGSTRGLVQVSQFYEQGIFISPALSEANVDIESMFDLYFKLIIKSLRPEK